MYSYDIWLDYIEKLPVDDAIICWANDFGDKQILRGHNTLRDLCLTQNKDLLIIDTDTLPKSEDVVEKLYEVEADIVSAPVRNPQEWNVFEKVSVHNSTLPVNWKPITLNTGPVYCDAVGFGCVLIKNPVLKEVKFSHSYKDITISKAHDILYCLEARDKNFKIACNTNLECYHFREKKPGKWVDDPGRYRMTI